ncbi:fibronectin type III domain-containing protein [Chryseosolibacter indicus]|uniref:Prolyl oligopeptidase family serine peptidase n=1 Tax=Chryseosolibacter indicus TaxID=2782351 RepID=A0ABS5VR54_9BACT|nr:prolyl oligopeptidase family serine peptidase [Chryseosolibacter indicus]MBT1703631.1 prolyl oligopeptidase family serine peptidase [Chryseosolibacter indicus]
MRKIVGLCVLLIVLHFNLPAQVDTSFVYKTGLSYGTLDIRLTKSSTRYYYLQEDRTVSYRESSPGVRTNTYKDLTSWDSSPYTQGNLREKNGGADYFVMNYRLLKPINYNASYDPGYPLIVFLHGAGERGNCWEKGCYFADKNWNPNTNNPAAPTDPESNLMNNDHNLLHGGSVHLSMRNNANGKLPNDPALPGRSFPGFVLFPQMLSGWNANTVQDAIRLVRLIAKKYNIDEDRIYIEGLSAGGYAVYETIKRAPWLFASVQTMSAVSDAGLGTYNMYPQVANLPMWTFQGGQDKDPTPNETAGYVRRFRDAGGIIRHTIYKELGHGTWNKAMNEADYFTWMLQQNKANIHVFGGSTAICNTNGQGVRMYLSEGFRAYQWEKNGAIIAGATSASYVATTTGTYRARFSRKANPGANDWNEWSKPVTVTESSPEKAEVTQIGTVILKDLNNFGDAKLKAVGKFEKYHWYKDGTKLSISDTISTPTFKAGTCSGPCTGNGAYTLVTMNFDGCPSPASDPVYIVFNNQAPTDITAPATFTGELQAGNSVKLNWANSSNNETGFEIWRRKQLTSTTYSKWEMRVLTAANATVYTDKALDPSSTYQYKIRAVSNTGRSNYTPSASNAFLVIKTGADNSAPTAPQNLTATTAGIRVIKLTWDAATDDSGIRQYRIYYGSQSIATNSTQTEYTLSDLPLNTVYDFTVKAEDLGGNLSAVSNTATGNSYVSGLYYEHSTGSWTKLDEIDWTALPEFTGTVPNFTLAPRTQEDYFNFEFDGYLYINTPGTYTFQTISSDGSRLTLDSVVIVNNDGLHASRTATSAAITLTAGPKRINLKYFEYDLSHVLTVRYRGPDTNNSYIAIPNSALKSGTPPTLRMASQGEPVVVESVPAMSVYPNPTRQDDINVQYEIKDNSPVQIRMIDFTGRQLFEGVFDATEVNQGVRIQPVQTINEGIYLLLINHNNQVVQQRISIKN